jgi:hypothetical protein
MTCSSILPIVLFALALTGVVRANDQQTQQACVNAAICLLAVRSGLSPDRRPDLQAHFMSSVFRECRGLVRSATVCRVFLKDRVTLIVFVSSRARGRRLGQRFSIRRRRRGAIG